MTKDNYCSQTHNVITSGKIVRTWEKCNRCSEQIKINEHEGSLFIHEEHGSIFLTAAPGMRWSALTVDAEATCVSARLFENC